MIELRRGDVVYYGERGEFSGKLRPGVVIQRQSTLDHAPSITLCGITSLPMPGHATRIAITPSETNGLDRPSYVMIDKIASIGRARVRQVFGQLDEDDMSRVDAALRSWLDL